MAKGDRILEAEESIQNIATELNRIRDCANLLHSAQDQVDAVLKSAERVMKTTGSFSEQCGVIVARLAESDLNQKLDNLRALHQELETAKAELAATIGQEATSVRTSVAESSDAIAASISSAEETSRSGFEQIGQNLSENYQGLADSLRNLKSQVEAAMTMQANAEKLARKRWQVSVGMLAALGLMLLVALVRSFG